MSDESENPDEEQEAEAVHYPYTYHYDYLEWFVPSASARFDNFYDNAPEKTWREDDEADSYEDDDDE